VTRSGAPSRAARAGGEVRFVLDGEIVRVAEISPQTTVLEYLRERLGRTGTKEGCAEGDCGACTVVTAELTAGGDIRWRPINACIRLLPTIDGKALVTVESLKGPDGALHPVQRALVECHASQCGFCTPGFALSLFALYKSTRRCERAVVDDALSGNLCRCTGYRPIIAAAQRMHALPAPSGWRGPGIDTQGRRSESEEERALADMLASLRRASTLDFEYAGQRYFAPTCSDELAALCVAHPEACLVAGATDVGLRVTKQHRDLGTIIFTGDVRELGECRTTASSVEIGAAVALTDAFASISAHYPALAEAWSRFGSVPIRNSGTLGGNIANGSPIGDSMPVLLALGARLVLRRDNARRELPLEDFYLGYQQTARHAGEFLESVHVPLPAPNSELRAYKLSKRFDQDISAVFACFQLRRDDRSPGARVLDIRIGCGGVAAIPKRAIECERALASGPWNDRAIAAAQAALERDFAPISDMRASAAYRITALKNLLRRFYLETTRPELATRAVEFVAP
jgi:xanthine dehydrogenase small subunit